MPAIHLCSILYITTLLTNEYNRLISRIKTTQLDYIAAGGTLAEEGLSTIRTAKAFGAQTALSDLYNVHVNRAHLLDLKLSVVMGIGMSGSPMFVRCSGLINHQAPYSLSSIALMGWVSLVTVQLTLGMF